MAALATKESLQYGRPRFDFPAPGGQGFVILPDVNKSGPARPWIWYAPSFIQVPYPLPKPLHEWYLSRLLTAGFAVAGVDVGESWGNPAGRAVFTDFHRAAVSHFNLRPKACLLAQSRGGLMHYNWAAEHSECVSRVGAIYPACDITRPSRLETLGAAYGLTPEQLLGRLEQHDPVTRLAPLAAARVPVFHIHGDRDEPVPLESNSGAFVRRYRELGGPAELLVMKGKGHEEVPEFFQCQELLDFFLAELRA
jgi:pimeloyl-ACP methyl ester carboxylesterase